jgi:hypothetical protein
LSKAAGWLELWRRGGATRGGGLAAAVRLTRRMRAADPVVARTLACGPRRPPARAGGDDDPCAEADAGVTADTVSDAEPRAQPGGRRRRR